MRIDVEPRVDVRAPDRPVVDPRHHGAARKGSGGRVPEGLLRQPSILVAIDDRRADGARSALRNPDQALLVAQTDLRCVDRSGMPDVTGAIVRGFGRAVVDTVPRGIRPLDEPVLEPVDEEAVPLPVSQRKDGARDQAAPVWIARAARAAEPRITTVGQSSRTASRSRREFRLLPADICLRRSCSRR